MSSWQATVDLLDSCIKKLQERAPLASPHELRSLLPQVPEGSQRFILVELIKFDLAASAEMGMNRRLSDYLAEFRFELPDAEVPPDLVLEELQILGECGIEFDHQVYLKRFPHLADILKNWHVRDLQPAKTLQPLGLNSRAIPELSIGERIEDFRILRCIGKGGFASVYLALQETLQRLVALKVSQRSSEESQTLSQLDHPNIVRVYDERNPLEPPVRLLYMQFVGGGSMADRLKLLEAIPLSDRSGADLMRVIAQHLEQCGLESNVQSESVSHLSRMDWPTTVAWVGAQLSEGLDYAHRQSVVHRDIKPANILFAADGTPRLADFNVSYSGIAGRAGAAAYFGGSLAYMSPEQIGVSLSVDGWRKAEDLDGRSDLFSLGVVLWEMLYGSRPWNHRPGSASWTEALTNELSLRRQPVVATNPEISFGRNATVRVLDHTIRACLAVDPNQRPSSGRQLKSMLRLALYPQAAKRIMPNDTRLIGNFAGLPPWLLLTFVGVVPNLIAAVFNFLYNKSQIVEKYPALWNTFLQITTWVNVLLFPCGIGWTIYLIVRHSRSLTRKRDARSFGPADLGNQALAGNANWPSVQAMPEISLDLASGSAGNTVNGLPSEIGNRSDITAGLLALPVADRTYQQSRSLDPASNLAQPDLVEDAVYPLPAKENQATLVESSATAPARQITERRARPKFAWNLGHHIALICGGLWFLAGLIFPVWLLMTERTFQWHDALHFFSSLTICGGVAMVYPFFWITYLNLALYYPMAFSETLVDRSVLEWGQRLRRLSRRYLITAAAIPLIALLLLVTAVDPPRHYLIITILSTAAGFAASLFAVQYIDDFVQDLEPALNSTDQG
jgi:eukaryotic-like serine/threonine-protein kinase